VGAGCTRCWDGSWEEGGGEGVWGIEWWIGVADVVGGMRHQRWIVESGEVLGSCDGRCLLWLPEVLARGCNGWIV
jgi:hypothetical protein